ncbi:uncharacterized protein LOC108626778 [Ceratina calcarata]|uniref:Uncharacterized protein LOC108626778 n=1 Tax=Ceratina calcarata TaxID=156304 RepID=A0AAJ7N8L3_9HYME|nr:uncharacterized protein LOC108626778 [Ceratina calcarata]XP_026670853.1 uncharacterized protein LOC108626778 [Ceratina calcarata]
MTESGTTRMKRNGARLFKNPPQPHMCIQDFIQGTAVPCYVNVLSWEKIAKPLLPTLPVQFYGGMRVRPPRTKAEAVVFAVMANPEVLRVNGKNARDPKKQAGLIELLLDFVERMNAGIVFTRQYTILKDRDITGELKDVWNAVQARRDMEQSAPQQETWIDAQPPVPQYPQYQEHQQQDYTSQPPQYHSSVAYGRMSNEGMHYEGYHQPQNPMITQNDQMYQSGQSVPQQYQGNVSRMAPIGSRVCRDNMAQDIMQQNCPAYPAPQYQFQQLPRQMVPQYVNSNVHPNAALNYGPAANTNVNPGMNTNLAPPFQPYITYQQRMDNAMHIDMRRMQPQQQQIHLNHVQPVPQYELVSSYGVELNQKPMNVLRLGRPHMGVAQKNNASKRQVNSPTHSKQSSLQCINCQNKIASDNGTKPKSPVKVLQREVPSNDRQDANNHISAETNKVTTEKSSPEETKCVQVTDLDEEVKKSNDSDGEISDGSRTSNDIVHSLESTSNAGREAANSEETPPAPEEKQQDVKNSEVPNGQNSSDQKHPKSKGVVVKGNKQKENTENNRTIRIRFVNDQKNESPKRSQTTVNSIIKSVFKIHPGVSGEETSGKRKTNGQAKNNAKINGENEDTQQGYTILKKTESTAQEEVATELAQLSIQDCKDVAEVSPVLS